METGRLWAWVVAAAWVSKGQPWRFWSHKEATYTVVARQPVVHTRCVNNNLTATDLSVRSIKFYDLSDLSSFQATGDFPLNIESRVTLENVGNTNTSVLWTWTTIAQPSSGASALAGIVIVPASAEIAQGIYSCTVDTRMAPATVQSTRNVYKVVTSHLKPSSIWMPAGTDATYGGGNLWPTISIEPEWARYLNPEIVNSDSTVFEMLATSAGLKHEQYPRV